MRSGHEIFDELCDEWEVVVTLPERNNFEHFALLNGVPVNSYRVVTHKNYAVIVGNVKRRQLRNIVVPVGYTLVGVVPGDDE